MNTTQGKTGQMTMGPRNGNGVSLHTPLSLSKMALYFSKYLAEHHKVENMLSRIEGNFYDAPFGKDEFDVVYTAGVLEHLDDTQAEKLLREMTSATKPGGYVVVAIPNE